MFNENKIKTNTEIANNQKSLEYGGYDSGVECVSCRSSETSSLSEVDETAVKIRHSDNNTSFYLNTSIAIETANGEEQFEKRSTDQPDPAPPPTELQKSNFIKFPNKQAIHYGWVVVFSCFWLNVIQAGIAFCGGIVLNALAKEFNETHARVSLISSFFNGFLLCSALVVDHLMKIMGLRIVCITGSFIAAAAFTTSIFSPNLETMIMTQGVVAGIGIGLTYLPSIIAPSFYFNDNKAVAYGIGICGQGI